MPTIASDLIECESTEFRKISEQGFKPSREQ